MVEQVRRLERDGQLAKNEGGLLDTAEEEEEAGFCFSTNQTSGSRVLHTRAQSERVAIYDHSSHKILDEGDFFLKICAILQLVLNEFTIDLCVFTMRGRMMHR